MVFDESLLEVLACPDVHHAPLTYDAAKATLTCTECGRVFGFDEAGFPVLIIDEALDSTAQGQ